jgi:hypothetical protein
VASSSESVVTDSVVAFLKNVLSSDSGGNRRGAQISLGARDPVMERCLCA